jgi:hypothetical protein
MPKITMIVCTHGDRVPLSRLLEKSRDCYDELIVVHDGPDFQDVRSLVAQYNGRFFERPRAYSQEPHIPFAIGEAIHDWILRFDSDEYPSGELKEWITEFRKGADVDLNIAGYRWICPAWNGRKRISMNWPNKFLRLFNRKKVTMIGLCENGAEPEPQYLSPKLPLRFWHESSGPSHGLRNIFGKQRTQQARANIARALLGSPLDHPRWRYESDQWPSGWQRVKRHPILTGLWRLFVWPPRQALAMLLAGDIPRPSVFLNAGIFHATLCFKYWRLRRQQQREQSKETAYTRSDPKRNQRTTDAPFK